MADLTLKDVSGRILNRLGEHIDEMSVRAEVDNIYRQLTISYPWAIKKTHSQFTTTPEYTTGTVALTNGSTAVTGSGTTFTSGMVGRLFIAGTYPQTIASYTGATSIALTSAWADSDVTGSAYSIRQHLYELATGVSHILTASCQVELLEMSIHQLERIDPTRESTGDPTHFIYRGWGTAGRVIELWPTPIDTKVISYVGLTLGSYTLSTSSTEMEDLLFGIVVNLASAACCHSIANRKESNFWLSSAMRYEQLGRAALEDARVMDLEGWSAAKTATDITLRSLVSSEYRANHDMEW